MNSTALVLPRKELNSSNIKPFQRLGFTFDSSNDETCKVKLPEGWHIVSNQTSSIILDNKNRRRIFSRMGFFSKKNDVKLLTRYRVDSKRIANDRFSPILVYVSDSDGNMVKGIDLCGTYHSEDYNQLVKKAENYLDENFPNWRDPDKYWD